MGTSCALFAVGRDHELLVSTELWIRQIAARLTRFSTDSEVARLNGAKGVEVSAELEELLRESLHAFEISNGLVNIAVLGSMLAIGYTRPLSQGPTPARLGDALPLPPLPDVLTVQAGRARLVRGCGIDLGGMAKGWMADRVLGAHGLQRPGESWWRPMRSWGWPRWLRWPVGIAGRSVRLRGGAATSSVLRRRWGDLHHLIDPRTGLPAQSGLQEVSVIASTALEAEVIAKTALLAGPDIAPAICAAHALAWWLGTPDPAASLPRMRLWR